MFLKSESLSKESNLNFFISKKEIMDALNSYSYLNPFSWDDKLLSLLRIYMGEVIDKELGDDDQINLKEFMDYVQDQAETILLDDDYFSSNTKSRPLVANWMNSPLRILPLETWEHVFGFLTKQELVRTSRVCRDFSFFSSNPTLMTALPGQELDYNEQPSIINLHSEPGKLVISKEGYVAFSFNNEGKHFPDMRVTVLDSNTNKKIILNPNFKGQVSQLGWTEVGSLIVISDKSECVEFKASCKDGYIMEVKDKQAKIDSTINQVLSISSTSPYGKEIQISKAHCKNVDGRRLATHLCIQNGDHIRSLAVVDNCTRGKVHYLHSLAVLPNGKILYKINQVIGTYYEPSNLFIAQFPELNYEDSLESTMGRPGF